MITFLIKIAGVYTKTNIVENMQSPRQKATFISFSNSYSDDVVLGLCNCCSSLFEFCWKTFDYSGKIQIKLNCWA